MQFVTFGHEMNIVTDAAGAPLDLYFHSPLDVLQDPAIDDPAFDDCDDEGYGVEEDEEDESEYNIDDEEDDDLEEFPRPLGTGGGDWDGDGDFFSAVNLNFD